MRFHAIDSPPESEFSSNLIKVTEHLPASGGDMREGPGLHDAPAVLEQHLTVKCFKHRNKQSTRGCEKNKIDPVALEI